MLESYSLRQTLRRFPIIRGGQSGTLTFFWNQLLTGQHLANSGEGQLKKSPCILHLVYFSVPVSWAFTTNSSKKRLKLLPNKYLKENAVAIIFDILKTCNNCSSVFIAVAVAQQWWGLPTWIAPGQKSLLKMLLCKMILYTGIGTTNPKVIAEDDVVQDDLVDWDRDHQPE